MSTSQPTFEGTTRADCRPTARVVIDGVEVPTVDGQNDEPPSVEIQSRNTGVADLTRSAEVHIPYEWPTTDGSTSSVLDTVTTSAEVGGVPESPFRGENRGFRSIGNGPIRIDILDTVTDEYVTAFSGAINNVGPSTLDGSWRIICSDWANYFESIAIDADFKNASLDSVLTTVQDTVNEHEGIPDFDVVSADVNTEGTILASQTVSNQTAAPVSPIAILAAVDQLIPGDNGNAQKSFHRYKHSVVDVLEWVSKLLDVRWYVEIAPQTGNLSIVIDPRPKGNELQGVGLLDDDPPDNGVRVIKNNALFQLGIQFTLGGRGKKTKTQNEPSEELPNEVTGSSSTTTVVPEVIVQHERLAEVAGENPNPHYIESNAGDLSALESQVTKQLQERMNDAAGGQILCQPSGFARPYATIEAQPACNGRLQQDIPSVTYSIHEVIHRISNPSVDENGGPRTILRCGIESGTDDFEVQSKRLISVN